MKKTLIYGSKEFAIVVKDLLDYLNFPFAGYIDDYFSGNLIIGNYEYIKKNFQKDEYQLTIAIGYNNLSARWDLYQRIKNDFPIISIIHDKAYIRDAGAVRDGTIIMTNAVVDTNVKIGELVVVWPGVVINHDCVIGDNTFLSPNCTVCGSVNIGSNCFIGAGAVIADHSIVKDNSFIKAGSVFSNK